MRVTPAAETDACADPPPFERYVAYVHGFDPAGAEKYAAMLGTGAARWARWRGIRLDVDGPRDVAPHVTRLVLTSRPGHGRPVQTTIEVLAWDDIVKRHWPNHPFAVRARVLAGFWRTIVSGTLVWLWRWNWPTLVSAALPGATTVLQLLGWLVVLAVAVAVPAGWIGPIAGPLALLTLGLLLWVVRRYEKANHWSWAGRFIGYAWVAVPADPLARALPSRREMFVDRIAVHLQDDDCVVIGHSGGAQHAAAIVADLAGKKGRRGRPPLLLTLGSLLVLVSRQRGACWLQDALARLARLPDLRWIDVSSPPDPACVAMVDPVEATFGTDAMGPGFRGPKMLNARFHANVPANRYDRARRDRVHMHFLYLRPVPRTEREDDFDLYAMLLADGPAEAALGHRSGRPPFATRDRHPPSPGIRSRDGFAAPHEEARA